MVDELRTARLLLRRWRADDAAALAPVLAANVAHLGDWIPRHVSAPGSLAALASRLTGFAQAFDDDREWRYAIFSSEAGTLLGEASLFARDGAARVPLATADRAEIGYWLRADATGGGLATEATRALLVVASALPALRHVEIRCDPRNARSAAIPRRLGFLLVDDGAAPADAGGAVPQPQIWRHDLPFGTS